MRERDPEFNQGLPLPDPDYDAIGGRVDPQAPESHGIRLRWWMEALYIGVFYAIYTGIRNTQGSARVGQLHAFNNAKKIIEAERAMRIFVEESVQQAFLGARWFMRSLNIFYGTGHFLVTLGALAWTYLHLPAAIPADAQHAAHHHRHGTVRVRVVSPDATTVDARQLRIC